MINWNNWSNKLQIRWVLYYFDYDWPVTTLKICLSPGLTWADNDWWSSSSWTFLEQPQHFKPTPASRYPHRTKNLIFPVAPRTFWQTEFTSCQEKHLSFHFLKGKTRTIKIPPSFGCFASPKMHKMHVRCKDANFLCNFFANFLSSKWFNAYSEEPHCCKFKKPNKKDNLLKLPQKSRSSIWPSYFVLYWWFQFLRYV